MTIGKQREQGEQVLLFFYSAIQKTRYNKGEGVGSFMIRYVHMYLVAILLVAGISMSFPSGRHSKAEAASDMSVHAKAAILVDAKSGKILFGQNMDEDRKSVV